MTTWQKIIKYGAILLAFFLIFQIIFLILWGFRLFGSFLGLYDEEEVVCSSHMTEIASETTFPSKLDIELNFTHLVIQRGSEFQVSSNSSAITYEKKDNTAYIRENVNFLDSSFGNEQDCLVISLPDSVFEKVAIEAGAGTIDISGLQSYYFELDQGAGRVSLRDVYIHSKADISGGAGEMNIEASTLTNADLDLGIGKFTFHGELIGKSEMNAGIGSVDLHLENGLNRYTFHVNKGIGSVTIQDEDIRDDSTYGQGQDYIDIDGGIGTIKILEA